eukprot:maker-scaffold_14-snap-gene-3.17-mRNA-1 protein AED:0.00 eAED:0.00 QI:370/1/1/1/0/0/2/1005/204
MVIPMNTPVDKENLRPDPRLHQLHNSSDRMDLEAPSRSSFLRKKCSTARFTKDLDDLDSYINIHSSRLQINFFQNLNKNLIVSFILVENTLWYAQISLKNVDQYPFMPPQVTIEAAELPSRIYNAIELFTERLQRSWTATQTLSQLIGSLSGVIVKASLDRKSIFSPDLIEMAENRKRSLCSTEVSSDGYSSLESNLRKKLKIK